MLRLFAFTVAQATLSSSVTASSSAPDLSQYSLTATLPIVHFDPPYTWPNYAPSLSIYLHPPASASFANVSFKAPIAPVLDTGSNGLLLDALDLNITNATLAQYEPGYQYLSSSTKLYRGSWIPFTLEFASPSGESVNVTAEIPVLVVNETLKCSGYQAEWEAYCPEDHTSSYDSHPRGTQWWGIGFGREADGQLHGTPDKNALINIKSINGVDVSSSKNYRAGYSLRKDGVVVGLTEENTRGYRWTKLEKQIDFSDDPRDWKNASGCVSIDGGDCRSSNVLVDTGLTISYLSTADTSVRLVPSNRSSTAKVLAAGQNVLVRFGLGDGDGEVQYNFTVGDASSLEDPNEVRTKLVDEGKEEKINTGVYFYREWGSAFDADGGWWGVKYVGNA
ncbi:hypothetical protein BBK36DRAFT_17664 [Trichoderma citrinoviride]|uniref:Acid protease n=1 Tax=Trichoderma citrinoviride TaxID=58853 RepID=A0A2T4BH30_9HYPO|nr:hypothetical protein BBK36DRAFT_17664 [Trichoderma citrinoviride]PTB68627.1 hypothetical protein BBK36DRAFT_17664 [Trichoderma citrinoviride]